MTSFGTIFDQTYPGSLSVVAAVASARSEDRLPVEPLDSGETGLITASYKLNQLGRRFDAETASAKVDFFLMFAGQQLWTYYRVKQFSGQPSYGVHVHSAAPVHDVPVVVTSFYVVSAMQDGTITFSEAMESGMIRISNDREGHVAKMFHEAFGSEQQAS
jgi:hypothetical protein